MTFFAEASDIATQRAEHRQMEIAGGLAEGSASAVFLVFAALFRFLVRQFGGQNLNRSGHRWTLGGWNAVASFAPDVSFLAETTLITAQRTEHVPFGRVARRLAHGTAGAEFFIDAALFRLGDGQLQIGNLHRNSWDVFALFWTNARAVGRFQIALDAEAAVHAWQQTEWTGKRILASRNAPGADAGAACTAFGIWAALASRWRSWYSYSKADAQSAE